MAFLRTTSHGLAGVTICLACRVAVISVAAANDNASGPWFEHNIADAWLHNYDPTLASRRIHAEISYEDDDGGASTTEFSWSARGALPLSENHALAYQLGWPVKWVDDGTETVSGMADLETRIGLITRLSPCLRSGVGLITKFDAATEPGLDDSAFVLRPVLALSWDISKRANLGINAQYSFTPKDENGNDLSYLELKLPLALRFNRHWSAEITYKPRWNFLANDDRHRLTLTTTRNWGDRRQFAWTLSTEIPLSPQSFDWKLGTGFSWYFR